MAAMPGCRTKRRQRSGSTDYDLVCSMEGFDVDFRIGAGTLLRVRMQGLEVPSGFYCDGEVLPRPGFHKVEVWRPLFMRGNLRG